ncbi:MAG: 3-oxoacyl-[acyl-carrier-protein] reductase [Tissierellales bacterium]|jgi:3-oxoacyl-[acyl-carrier protein] reductase|nr:3-oxoacyl-[acyl-carrier-protein] reductase [Tissierellales bacterium]
MLKGKTAIVTGGSRGIGKAIAMTLAKQGANIVINYRSRSEEAENTLEEIKALGVETLLVQADISKFEQAENLIKQTKEQFGSVDILVNNAGITQDNLMMRMTEEEFDNVIAVNLKGTFNCIRHVAKIMSKQKSGRIINLSSVSGLAGNIGQINYAASKSGVIGMTKTAARELAKKGVTVNAIAPGFIETEMTGVLSEDVKKQILSQIPLKRMGSVNEIAGAVLFLASEAGAYVTGQTLTVDGGMTM